MRSPLSFGISAAVGIFFGYYPAREASRVASVTPCGSNNAAQAACGSPSPRSASNKLRTGLALLGMTIGVAAVFTMFALGTGAQENVSSDVRSAGTTLIFVRAGNFTRGGEESNIADRPGLGQHPDP